MPFLRVNRALAAVPDGRRIYAVGDIHGKAGLFAQLIARIEDDSLTRGSARVTIVILGDFIDRGPRSADMTRILMHAQEDRVTVLKGNHEAALVDAYRGDDDALRFWLEHGGKRTLASFGIAGEAIEEPATPALLRRAIGEGVIDWLDHLPLSLRIGDYFFVHAGIRPGVPLDRQSPNDLLWIREPFLSSRRDHGAVVVHGHTIEDTAVVLGGNRINVDTGAYRTGRLTALGLEGTDQWLIEATGPAAA